jgi:hypothetical protein
MREGIQIIVVEMTWQDCGQSFQQAAQRILPSEEAFAQAWDARIIDNQSSGIIRFIPIEHGDAVRGISADVLFCGVTTRGLPPQAFEVFLPALAGSSIAEMMRP